MAENLVKSILQWLMKGIEDSFIPIILSISISLLANKTFVQRGQEKRLHSETINDESFKVWLDKIYRICPIDMENNLPRYSHEAHRIVPIKLEKLDLIPHHKYLESHMKTGYLKEWRSWEKLQKSIITFNKQIADILEDIHKEIHLECIHLSLYEYYDIGLKQPLIYIKPDKLADQIYKEIMNRLSGHDVWMYGNILKSHAPHDKTKVFTLRIGNGNLIMGDTNEERIDAITDFIPKYIEDQNTILKIQELKQKENMLIEQRYEFRDELNDIISNIELGRSAKGKCSNCSRLFELLNTPLQVD